MKDWKDLTPAYRQRLLDRVGTLSYTKDEITWWTTCQGYAEKTYVIEITGLSEEDANTKVLKFQKENFFNISISKLSHLSLEDCFIRIERGLSLIKKENLNKAIEGLDWVLDCWRSGNESESAGIKYKRLKNKLISISNNNELEAPEKLPTEFELSELKNNPEFYGLFRPEHRDKIHIIVEALKSLEWINSNQDWNTVKKTIGAVNGACCELEYFNYDNQAKNENIICRRFNTDYERNKRVSQYAYHAPKDKFIEKINSILNK